MSSNNGASVDSKEVLIMLTDLAPKNQKKVYRAALRKSANKLVTQTRINLRSITNKSSSKNWWNGKTLQSGVKSSVSKDVKFAKVHILGDFRLNFFEKGTVSRYTTGKSSKSVRGRTPSRRQRRKASRGKINAKWFFRNARTTKEKEILDSLNSEISNAINKINDKHKNR